MGPSARRALAAVAVTALFAATSAAWAASSGVLALDSVGLASSLTGGSPALVTALAGNFTVQQGAAQKTTGIEVYRIDLGSTAYSDSMMVQFAITNPHEMRRVFGNPNAFLEVGLWYADPAGTHTLSDGTTKVSRDGSAVAYLNQGSAYALLEPVTPDAQAYWLLASVTVPGGAPPGVQSEARELEFWVDVRIR